MTGVLALIGCTPELPDRTSLVTGPRVLAVASTPAEAEPAGAVTLRALYVDAQGERAALDLDWAFCVARRALTDEGTVSPDCLARTGEDLVPLGGGAKVQGTLPADGCRLFGPDPPEPKDGEPAGRPVDPDPSGGYYQPVRLLAPEGGARASIGAARLACGLAGATAEVASDFGARYRRNENPAIASLAMVRGGASEPIAPGEASVTVRAGEQVTLRASWHDCPTTPVCGDGICGIDEDLASCPAECAAPRGCTGAEPYLLFDPVTRALVARREAVRVSWFVTGGELGADVVGRGADEASPGQVDNTWVAPATPGETRLWLVIRDDRGGIGWESYGLTVAP